MKTKINVQDIVTISLAATLACLAPLSTPAQIISVNFTDFATDVQRVDEDETFGIPGLGTVVGGWINLNRTLNATNLAFSDGSSSSVGLSLTAPNGWASFNAAYDDSPLKGGLDDYTGTVGPTSLTLGGLNSSFPSGYYTVLYLTGFNGNNGASISDGTTTYYYQPLAAPAAPVSLVQTLTTGDLGDGNAPEAQYAVFGSLATPLTADGVTFTLDTLYGGGAGLGGVQIVGVPEPTAGTLLLLGLASLLVTQFRRRLRVRHEARML